VHTRAGDQRVEVLELVLVLPGNPKFHFSLRTPFIGGAWPGFPSGPFMAIPRESSLASSQGTFQSSLPGTHLSAEGRLEATPPWESFLLTLFIIPVKLTDI
jgi:hypothetical protein